MKKLLYNLINHFSAFILGIIVGFMLHSEAVAKPIDLHKQSKVEGLSGTVDASYSRETGNSDKTQSDAEGYTQFLKKNAYILAFAAEGEITQEAGREDGQSNLAHIRYRRFYSSFLGLEAYLHHEENSNRNLTFSHVIAAGPYLRIFNSPFALLDVGAHLALEWEKHKLDGSEYANRTYQYASIGFQLPQQLLLGHSVQYEPKIAEASDFRIFNISSIKVKANKYVNLGFDLDQMYDSNPATNTSNKDVKLKAVLGVEW